MLGTIIAMSVISGPPEAITDVLLARRFVSADGAGHIGPAAPPCSDPLVELIWDGASTTGAKAQDFESVFDIYDLFIIEDFRVESGVVLDSFATLGFGNGTPEGATDVGVRIFEDNGSGLPGQDGYTGRLRMMSIPGSGFFDGEHAITDMGGQCLPGGSYFVVWAVRLDFGRDGQIFFLAQAGDYSAGAGRPDDAWNWMPGDAIGMGTHFPVLEFFSGEQIGVNFLLCGQPGDCDIRYCQADFTGSANPGDPNYGVRDGDIDADDFFFYMDFFVSGDARADLNGSAFVDSEDFFTYLDWFVTGCD